MSESKVISKAPPRSVAADYPRLREMGIGYIERFASDLWTDYNKHDPGITTMELLCYAISDLSLRTQLPFVDVLTSSFGSADALQEAFLTADLILPTSPVTEADYRKLFIDMEGVRNAWIQKADVTVYVDCRRGDLTFSPKPLQPANNDRWTDFKLNGLYDILIDFDEVMIRELIRKRLREESGGLADPAEIEIDAFVPQEEADTLARVKKVYLDNRCLCEDISGIKQVPVTKIMICADIQLVSDANVAEVHAYILFEIQKYLSPLIRRYSLAELRAADTELTFERIYEGPLLTNGFIRDNELEDSELKERVYTSDLINLIMSLKINGKKVVEAINKVRLNILLPEPEKPCAQWRVEDPDGAAWCLHIPAGTKPELCIEKTALNFSKSKIPVGSAASRQKAYEILQRLSREEHLGNIKTIDTPKVPTGEILALNDYQSIINDFPQNYGIGPFGLPESATAARKAKAKQFKAYLLFFDQFLADYLAQLKNLSTLFSTESSAATYFSQKIEGVADIAELYDNYATLDTTLTDALKTWEGYEDNPDRKNRFFDHMLARFGGNLSEYAMLVFSLFDDLSSQDILENKAAFLRNFFQRPSRNPGETSADWEARSRKYFRQINHAHAYNYCEESWGTENVAGVTQRIASLLGMKEFRAIEPVLNEDERLFLIENILLRPDPANAAENWIHICTEPDCSHCRPLDPYSYRVSIVLPGYTERVGNIHFRRYAEKVIREELPAHVLARICWVKQEHLTLFAEKYRNWLFLKESACTAKNPAAYADALNQLLQTLDELYTIYPGGVLHDCDSPDETPIILGSSALGSLKSDVE